MSKIRLILLALVLGLGIYLRSPEVIIHNQLFGYDQGRDYLEVKKIVVDKKLTLIGSEIGAGYSGFQGIFHGPYYYYLLALPFYIFHGDPYGGIVLMFILGVIALIIGFIVIRKIFGFWAALIFLLLLDLALYAQSRFIWNTHPATLIILLVFWFAYKSSQKNYKYFPIAVFLAGIIYGFQIAISVCLLATLFIWVILILKAKEIKLYLRSMVAVLLAYSPFLLFEFRHGFQAFKGIGQQFLGILNGSSHTNLFTGLSANILSFWFNFRDSFYLPDRLRFCLFIILTIASLWFLINEKKSDSKDFLAFLFLLIPTSFIIFLFLKTPVWNHYLVHLHLAYIILFAYFLIKSKLKIVRIGLLILLLLMTPLIYKEIIKAKKDFSDYGGVAKVRGKIDAIDYIYQDAGDQKFNVLVFTPPVYDYAYRYLLTWYGEKKYHYVPGDQKEGLFYLWIETDPKQSWSYRGWLETVIKTGKVIKEEKLPSGFIIQKRYAEK